MVLENWFQKVIIAMFAHQHSLMTKSKQEKSKFDLKTQTQICRARAFRLFLLQCSDQLQRCLPVANGFKDPQFTLHVRTKGKQTEWSCRFSTEMEQTARRTALSAALHHSGLNGSAAAHKPLWVNRLAQRPALSLSNDILKLGGDSIMAGGAGVSVAGSYMETVQNPRKIKAAKYRIKNAVKTRVCGVGGSTFVRSQELMCFYRLVLYQ